MAFLSGVQSSLPVGNVDSVTTLKVMLTRFKLGEFDETEGRPYQHVDESLLDSAQHRAMAREAAAASIVMAHNDCNKKNGCTLPYTAPSDVGVGVVRCAFSDRVLHSRMPLDPTHHVRLKRTCV
jgi:beta-glucosidase-like glycosyl hydrolase